MHVGFFAAVLPGKGGTGITTYVGHMRDALQSLGHQVTLVTEREVLHDGGTVESIKSNRDPILAAFEAAGNVDVFEIEESFGWASNLVGRGVPIVMRLHGPNEIVSQHCDVAYGGEKRSQAEREAIHKVDAVSYPSQFLRDRFTDPKRGAVIYNPQPLSRDVWNLEKADLNKVLFVGRKDRLKGYEIAVEAAQQAGMELVEAVDKSPEEIHQLRLQCGLAFVPSRFESFSYVTAEAMACGMPVLANRWQGTFVPVAGGKVYDFTTPAEAIREMLSDPVNLAETGKRGREFVTECFDPKAIAEETLTLYQRTIASSSFPRRAFA